MQWFPANIGALCHIETDGAESAVAEVIGFHHGNNLLSLHDFGARIRVGARVTLFDDGAAIPVGDETTWPRNRCAGQTSG